MFLHCCHYRLSSQNWLVPLMVYMFTNTGMIHFSTKRARKRYWMVVEERFCMWCLQWCSFAHWTSFANVVWRASTQTCHHLTWVPTNFSNWLGKLLQFFRMMQYLYCLYYSFSWLQFIEEISSPAWNANIAIDQQAWLRWLLIVNASIFQHVAPYPSNVTWGFFVGRMCTFVQEFTNSNDIRPKLEAI